MGGEGGAAAEKKKKVTCGPGAQGMGCITSPVLCTCCPLYSTNRPSLTPFSLSVLLHLTLRSGQEIAKRLRPRSEAARADRRRILAPRSGPSGHLKMEKAISDGRTDGPSESVFQQPDEVLTTYAPKSAM